MTTPPSKSLRYREGNVSRPLSSSRRVEVPKKPLRATCHHPPPTNRLRAEAHPNRPTHHNPLSPTLPHLMGKFPTPFARYPTNAAVPRRDRRKCADHRPECGRRCPWEKVGHRSPAVFSARARGSLSFGRGRAGERHRRFTFEPPVGLADWQRTSAPWPDTRVGAVVAVPPVRRSRHRSELVLHRPRTYVRRHCLRCSTPAFFDACFSTLTDTRTGPDRISK